MGGGNVELNMDVANGLITAVKIYGDFLSQKELSDFEQLFVGQRYERECIRRILQSVEVGDYFRNVTAEEMLVLFF